MDKALLSLAIALSVATAIADSFLKKAAISKSGLSTTIMFVVGALIYLVTAFGWFKVLQKTELLNAGVIYTLSFIVFIALISVFYFKERLLATEAVGLGLAIISIFLMYRYN